MKQHADFPCYESADRSTSKHTISSTAEIVLAFPVRTSFLLFSATLDMHVVKRSLLSSCGRQKHVPALRNITRILEYLEKQKGSSLELWIAWSNQLTEKTFVAQS